MRRGGADRNGDRPKAFGEYVGAEVEVRLTR